MSEAAPEFEMSTTSVGEGIEIVMSGHISERSVLELPTIPGKEIHIDTRRVERINSLGVGAWIRYLAKLCSMGVPVTIRPLSVALVSQANMISNFLASARVENFLAPYYCPDCEHSAEQLYPIQAEVFESIKCEKCQSDMEFDDEMKAFLTFRQ